MVRILSGATYPNRLGGPQNVLALLTELQKAGNHTFWPDNISVTDTSTFNLRLAGNSKSITDIYLLGLARSKGGKLATFDRRIDASAVTDGTDALHIIAG